MCCATPERTRTYFLDIYVGCVGLLDRDVEVGYISLDALNVSALSKLYQAL